MSWNQVRDKNRILWGALGIALAGLWAVLRSGTGIVPGADWHFAATPIWPERPLNPDEWYLSDSPLGIIAARLLGFDTVQQFLQLHAVVVLLALSLLAAWAFVATADRGARWQATRLSLLAPTGAILLTWIGRYDAFTALVWALALFAWSTRRRVLLVAAGLLLGFQHFEHALMGAFVLWLTWMALRPQTPDSLRHTNPLWLVPGIALGKLALVVVFATQSVPISGRVDWVERFIYDWTVTAVSILPLLIWSLFAGWWAVGASLYLDASRRGRRLLLLALMVGILATLLSGDRPRVFVLIFLPAIALGSVVFARSALSDTKKRRLVEVIVWLAPPFIFWGDAVTNVNIIDPLVIAFQELFGSS